MGIAGKIQRPRKTHSRSASLAAVLSVQPRSPCIVKPKPADRVWALSTGGSSRSYVAAASSRQSLEGCHGVSLGGPERYKENKEINTI